MDRAVVEELVRAAEALLHEAEDVFVCMADANRHTYPPPYLAARAAIEAAESELNKPIDMGR